MVDSKNRKDFFKKHLTRQKNGCIMHIVKGNGVFKFDLKVPLSHFNNMKKAKASFVLLRRAPLSFLGKKEL